MSYNWCCNCTTRVRSDQRLLWEYHWHQSRKLNPFAPDLQHRRRITSASSIISGMYIHVHTLIHRDRPRVRIVAHIFCPVSACPLRLPIYVHVTVQSAVVKSDSGRRNICKTRSRSSRSLLFAYADADAAGVARCGYLRDARPISAVYKCVIKRSVRIGCV